MTRLFRQARNLIFLGLLLFSLPALAEAQDNSGPTGAGGDKTFSAKEAFTGLADAFNEMIPTKDELRNIGKKKPAKQEEGKTIEAKRLDKGPTTGKQEPKVAPYKVYPSPMIRDDAPVYEDPYPAAVPVPSSPDAFTGWQKEVKTLDSGTPPPLPGYYKPEEDEKQEPLPTLAEPAQANESKEERKVPPISALPKQYFPILPSGALPNTPPQLLPVASSEPLEADHRKTRRTIIVIHDVQRNAAEGVATLMTLVGSAGDDTLILAPQFPLELDILRFAPYLPQEGLAVARWPINRGWQVGGFSTLPRSKIGISSFSAVDLLLMFLADHIRFPALEQVVIAGHGMGGDFVQLYAAAGQAPDFLRKLGVGVRFVVANPSTYLYFTGLRTSENNPAFIRPDPRVCEKFNSYPYGLGDLDNYAKSVGASAIRLRYPERNVVYLVGDNIRTDNFIDQSCAARLQGKDRLSRGKNYARHLMQSFGPALGKNQFFVFVPKAGYDPVSLYGSFCGMESLFGNGACGQ